MLPPGRKTRTGAYSALVLGGACTGAQIAQASETDFEICLSAPRAVALARRAAIDDPKVGVVDIGAGATRLRTVKQIEEIHSQFCGDALAEEKLLCKSAVQVIVPRGAKAADIPRGVPREKPGIRKCRLVKHRKALVIVVVIYAEFLSGNEIGTIEAVAERIIIVGKDRKRRTARSAKHAAPLPAAYQVLSNQSPLVQELLPG